jgi:hypothetical protein
MIQEIGDKEGNREDREKSTGKGKEDGGQRTFGTAAGEERQRTWDRRWGVGVEDRI